MSTADFDQDGDIDIVNGLDDDGNPGSISMLVNRGSGGVLAWAAPYVVFDVTPTITSGSDSPGVGNGTSYDFDRDGYPDLLAGWTPEGLCAVGTGFSCAWREVSLIRNLTREPCGEGLSCDLASDTCVACTPDCGARRCGDDGCGGSCGVCPPAEACVAGQCVSKLDCVPQCSGKVCGDNGCGGICGRCAAGSVCSAGQCLASCTPQCTQANGQPKPCGDDGCGGQCIILGDEGIVAQEQNQDPGRGRAVERAAAPRRGEPRAADPARRRRPVVVHAGRRVRPRPRDAPLSRTRTTRSSPRPATCRCSPHASTGIGDFWHCVIRATDGTEFGPSRADAPRAPSATDASAAVSAAAAMG